MSAPPMKTPQYSLQTNAANEVESPKPQGNLLLDLPLGLGAKIMFLFLNLLFLLPALLVLAVVFDGLYRGEFGKNTQEQLLLLGIPSCFLLLFSWLLVWVLRGFDLRQRVFSDGYEHTYRGKTRFCPFRDIVRLHDESYLAGKYRVLLLDIVLELRDGTRISPLKDSSFSSLHPRLDTSSQLYNIITGVWKQQRGSEAIRRIEAGEVCDYGLIQASREGLRIDTELIAWSRIGPMSFARNYETARDLVLNIDGKNRAMPASKVPDHPALAAVLEKMTKRAL